MRSDMKKVLCERGRAHSTWSYHDVRAANNRGDYEDLPAHQGISRPYGYETKEFNDLISPLRRYLHSAVGRPWNDVWSEICQHVPANTVTGQHLRDHVRGDVDGETHLVDGEVMVTQRYRSGFYPPRGLYVHPRTGLLMVAQDERRGRAAAIKYFGRHYLQEDGVLYPRRCRGYPVKPINEHREAVFVKGIWYQAELKEVPPPIRRVGLTGVVSWVTSPQYDAIYCCLVHSGVYHTNKMQLSSNSLRRLGLWNQH